MPTACRPMMDSDVTRNERGAPGTGSSGAARAVTAPTLSAPRDWSRRRLIRAMAAAGLGLGTGALLAACGSASGATRPSARGARLGFLSGNVQRDSPETEALRQGLRALGYVEGRN